MLFGIDRQFGIQEQSTIRRISGKFIGRKINNWTKCLILLSVLYLWWLYSAKLLWLHRKFTLRRISDEFIGR